MVICYFIVVGRIREKQENDDAYTSPVSFFPEPFSARAFPFLLPCLHLTCSTRLNRDFSLRRTSTLHSVQLFPQIAITLIQACNLTLPFDFLLF